jgi:hypothetical protein
LVAARPAPQRLPQEQKPKHLSALRAKQQPKPPATHQLKNAQSYDPYRVYLLEHDRPARYDLALSKAYTLAHYCQWHGPKCEETFVAVGPTTGSAHCRVMTDPEFASCRQKHNHRQ